MNKEDLSKVRKHFKTDSERLSIHSIYNVICMSKTFIDISEDSQFFDMLDEDVREKFILSFKKILMGGFDTNLFNLNFNKDNGIAYQKELLSLRDNSLEKEEVTEFVRKIVENANYGTDVLVSLITATVIVPTKAQKKAKDEDYDLDGYSYDIVMCMVSKLNQKTASFALNKSDKKIILDKNYELLDIKNPIEGFTFPSYNDGLIDVNNVLYFTSKKDEPNELFVKNVLGCERNITAKVQKEVFNKIIKSAIGDKVNTKTLSDIYEGVKEVAENSGETTVSSKEVTRVLKEKGFDNEEKIEEAIATALKRNEVDLSIENIIPNKQIELKNQSISVKIVPEKLKNIVQTNKNGKKVLIIELDEDINIDDFKIRN